MSDANIRSEDAWWSWHDADQGRLYETTKAAEAACAAWVAGTSDVGPEAPAGGVVGATCRVDRGTRPHGTTRGQLVITSLRVLQARLAGAPEYTAERAAAQCPEREHRNAFQAGAIEQICRSTADEIANIIRLLETP